MVKETEEKKNTIIEDIKAAIIKYKNVTVPFEESDMIISDDIGGYLMFGKIGILKNSATKIQKQQDNEDDEE